MYRWFLVLHIISVIAWFAGLFYIFRLFVYHVMHREKREMAAVYQTMEWKLIYIIMHPAMMLTFVFGIGMVVLNPGLLHEGWFHLKLTAVILLTAYHFLAGWVQKQFAKGRYVFTEKACRVINEVPTVLLIVIVILVILKPAL